MRGSAKATLAGVKKEMAKSRVAKSARKEYANLGLPTPTIKPRKLPTANKQKVVPRMRLERAGLLKRGTILRGSIHSPYLLAVKK
jgi:hypothetical protein